MGDGCFYLCGGYGVGVGEGYLDKLGVVVVGIVGCFAGGEADGVGHGLDGFFAIDLDRVGGGKIVAYFSGFGEGGGG